MAQLPRRLALHLSLLLLAAALTAAAPARAAELSGTWHVLVHYTDANSGKPDQLRWNDRIWVFESKGSKLRWTEYPIVVFGNDSGRFERLPSGQYARVLGAWEPSDSQLTNIESGLKINSRGAKKKSLRGSDEEGWTSTARARAASASVITFQENWSVEGAHELPVFAQHDVMASARTESLEGVTRYETTAIEDGGNTLRGLYQRDGTREGTFVMRRSGDVGRLEKRDQREIQEAAFQRSVAAATRTEAARGIDRIVSETGLQVPAEQREKLEREAVQLIELGRSPAEVSQVLKRRIVETSYAWARQDPEHLGSVRYRMPFASEAPVELRLGFRPEGAAGAPGDRRGTRDRHTLVFALPSGSDVAAARPGSVVEAGDRIVVLHEDATFAVYTPLAEADVPVGAKVRGGEVIGRSRAGRLSFGVYAMEEGDVVDSLRVRFDDGSPAGFEPVQGRSYPGGAPSDALASP